jgi:pimeloyl-ACP methyl ester carboxylesterase
VGLAYKRAGAGPTLVLLHGIGHRRQAWDAVFDRLTPHRDVIAVDLPGHGESPPFELGDRTVAQALGEEITGLFDELGLDRPHLAGNSLGGRIALDAAALGRAASVTALSPAGFWRNARELAYAKRVFAVMQVMAARLEPVTPRLAKSTAGRALLGSSIVRHPSRMSPAQAAGDASAFLAARPALNAILDGIDAGTGRFAGVIPEGVPVTIAWGDRDRLLPRRQALVARELIPQATFVRLPSCGHVPMTDDPELVTRVLLNGSSLAGERQPAASQTSDIAQ